jgi:hypothetical protein
MTEAVPAAPSEIGRFHRAICILEEFDCAEMRGVIKGTLSPNRREECFIGTYYRAALNVHSLVFLNDPKHLQAIAQISRTLLELAVDMRLLAMIDNAADKVVAFSDWERLKSAREAVSLGGRDTETDLAANYVRDHEQRITARREELWPDERRLNHWSAMDLPGRVQTLKAPFDELYKSQYRRLSWYAHAGLTGVLNFEAEAFEAVAGTALHVAAECYDDILRAIISELQLDKAVDRIYNKLDLARVLAFTDNREQAEAARRYIVG